MGRLFVTGLGGYLGSELGRQAPAAGWEVAGIAGSAELDVRDGPAVRAAVGAARPDVVVHTAYRMDDAERQRRGHARGRRRGGRRRRAPGPPLQRPRLRRHAATRALTEDDEPRPGHALRRVQARGRAPVPARRAARAHLAHLRRARARAAGARRPRRRRRRARHGLLHRRAALPDRRRRPRRRGARAGGAGRSPAPLHVAGADALTRLEFARLDLRAPRARPRRRCAASPAAPTGPSTSSSTARGRAPCCACACAARARCCRREGGRRRRRRGRAHHRRVPARGRASPRTSSRARSRRTRPRPWPRRSGTPTARCRQSGSPRGRRPPTSAGRGSPGVAGSGVRMRAGTELLAADAPDPWWRDAVPGLRRTREGLRFVAPVVDMSRPPAVAGRTPARARRRDRAPSRRRARRARRRRRGQLRRPGRARAGRRRVADRGARAGRARARRPAVQEWLLDQSDPRAARLRRPARATTSCSAAPRRRAPRTARADPATTAAIRARCAALVPALRDAPVVGVAVGLRPARPAVRLEAEGRVVHCYGHGGAGVTLAWGCAVEVAALLGRARPALRCSAVK